MRLFTRRKGEVNPKIKTVALRPPKEGLGGLHRVYILDIEDLLNDKIFPAVEEAFRPEIEGIDILGDIWKETIVDYMNDETAWDLTPLNWKIYNVSVMTLEVWTLFGDPTLKIGGYE